MIDSWSVSDVNSLRFRGLAQRERAGKPRFERAPLRGQGRTALEKRMSGLPTGSGPHSESGENDRDHRLSSRVNARPEVCW